MADNINRVKVFSATKARARDHLGERLTSWIEAHPRTRILKLVVLQSSDRDFHCISLVLLCHEEGSADAASGSG